MSINIAIADDHELVREGLKKIFRQHHDLKLVGEATDIAGTLELLARTGPDILILDLSLDNAGDLEALHAVRSGFPKIPVLVLSMHAEERCAVRAVKAGACGYVTKSMAAAEVVAAVRKIVAGGRYVGVKLAEMLAAELVSPAPVAAHERLTVRETEVLRLLGAGFPIKKVAAMLDLSISSVSTYRLRIFRKMDLKSTAALIRYALEHNLIQ